MSRVFIVRNNLFPVFSMCGIIVCFIGLIVNGIIRAPTNKVLDANRCKLTMLNS